MVRLSDFIKNYSQKDAEILLRKFYQGAYDSGSYDPPNSINAWKKILKIIPPFRMALDVGCGSGEGIKYAREQGLNVWGMDIAYSQSLWQKNGIDKYCVVGDATAIPFKERTFDYILCSDLLEHIPEWSVSKVLSELKRVSSGIITLGICLIYELSPFLGKVFTHITVKPSQWWLEKINKVDLTVIPNSGYMGEIYMGVHLRRADGT